MVIYENNKTIANYGDAHMENMDDITFISSTSVEKILCNKILTPYEQLFNLFFIFDKTSNNVSKIKIYDVEVTSISHTNNNTFSF